MSLSVCIAPSRWVLVHGAQTGWQRPALLSGNRESPVLASPTAAGVASLHTLAAGNTNDLAPGGGMNVISAGSLSARVKSLIESHDGGDRETAGRRLGIASHGID